MARPRLTPHSSYRPSIPVGTSGTGRTCQGGSAASKPASWSYPEPARRTRSVAVSLTRTSASGACCARGPPRTLLSWQQPPQSARRSTASLIRSPRTLRSRGGLRAGRRPPFEREERALSLRIRMHVTSQLKNRVGHNSDKPRQGGGLGAGWDVGTHASALACGSKPSSRIALS